jgi:hypothetical protein
MESTKKKSQSTDSRIVARIQRRGRGSVLVPSDFFDFGSREAVDLALHRLARKGTIRRLARGVYDYPKEHPVLGPLSPSADAVARALAGRDRTRLQPAGAYAANALGLSEQGRRPAERSERHRFTTAVLRSGVPKAASSLSCGARRFTIDS